MNGGRARIDLEYDIGFDDNGKIHALDLRLFLLGGIVMGGSTVDVFSLAAMLDQVQLPLQAALHQAIITLYQISSHQPFLIACFIIFWQQRWQDQSTR